MKVTLKDEVPETADGLLIYIKLMSKQVSADEKLLVQRKRLLRIAIERLNKASEGK